MPPARANPLRARARVRVQAAPGGACEDPAPAEPTEKISEKSPERTPERSFKRIFEEIRARSHYESFTGH